MANAARRPVNYRPRMSDLEAYDLLPTEVRAALRESVTDFGALQCLNHLQRKKMTVAQMVRWIRDGSLAAAARPLIPARGVKGRPGYVAAMPSTYTELGVRPL